MSDKVTMATLSRDIITEGEAYAYLEHLRWNGTPICSHCGGSDVYLIGCRNGVSRATRTGAQSERRVWKCRNRECRKQFSVLTGTVMSGTKIPIRVWVLVFFEFVASKNGTAAREIERKYGVCPRTAWHLLHRIREAMAHTDGTPFSGNVVADEVYLGGTPKNWHANDPRHGRTGRGTHKTPVVSVVNVETRKVRSRVVTNVDGQTLIGIMRDFTERPMTHLHTDALPSYRMASILMASHHWVDHSAGEYVNDKSLGTNKVENYFSQLRRSLDGSHHHVSRKHLERYVREFDYRYSTRDKSDPARMADLLSQVEGRLTYADLKGA